MIIPAVSFASRHALKGGVSFATASGHARAYDGWSRDCAMTKDELHTERQVLRRDHEALAQQHTALVGKKPFDKLPEYINAADLMIVPSVWMEAFGQVTIEGMACGIPVVTTNEAFADWEYVAYSPSVDYSRIADMIVMPYISVQSAREYIVEHHSLVRLMNVMSSVIIGK